MKYSFEMIINLSLKEYVELIVDELNKNGFRIKGLQNGKEVFYEYSVPDSPSYFIFGITDYEAIEFLKRIGLLDNGKCPATGKPLGYDRVLWQNGKIGHIRFFISKEFYDQYYGRVRKTQKGCCLFFLLIIGIIAYISYVLFFK